MTYAYGVTWGGRERSAMALVAAAVVTAILLAAQPAATDQAVRATGEAISVIVRRLPGSGDAADRAVQRAGGDVEASLGIIDSFTATVSADAVAGLETAPGVAAVTLDGRVRLESGDGRNEWLSDKDLGSLYTVAKGAGVHDAYSEKLTGEGVGVALIDSGIVPVEGLGAPGKVINGPDLSFESQAGDLRHLDSFGHGTHMAGIIAGRDPEVKVGNENDSKWFVGVAPDAHLLNMKVASADGATDVSQVIAALDWVVQHRNDPGMNIRVVNLSFGTNSTQSYLLDPLAHAVEAAWRSGLVVVVSAGNEGNLTASLTNPAIDPFVIAVGAADHNGSENRKDDKVADFSSRGSLDRTPDLVAPGRSLVSLRSPGSFVDQENPTARVAYSDPDTKVTEQRLFRGSGTSQAAAMVSGVVALLLQQRPTMTPDQVKKLLTSSSDSINGADRRLQGAGLLDVKDAVERRTPSLSSSLQSHARSTGLGSLEAARGGSHVADPEDGTELVGEQDIFGRAWDGRTWASASSAGTSWAGGAWMGRTWAGGDWSGTSWAGRTWAGRTWADANWAGRTWAGRTWADAYWNGRTWAGRTWAEAVWAGRTWAGRTWAGRTWAGVIWT